MSLRFAALGERLAQEFAAGGVVSGLEAAEELVQGVQHLLGEALGHLVLVLAAAFEQGGETVARGAAPAGAVRPAAGATRSRAGARRY